jgi:dihydropyrimidine dehydrogenase (NAD+) subunit PreT
MCQHARKQDRSNPTPGGSIVTITPQTDGIRSGRLDRATLAENFDDLYPRFDDHEARVAADRCYFCHDAPCITACPTEIDIPLFIRQIQAGSPRRRQRRSSIRTSSGGMCARVCPTETLCEGACVREMAEGSRSRSGGCSATPPTR